MWLGIIFFMPILETFGPFASLIVRVPVERVDGDQSLRGVQAKRRDALQIENKRNDLLFAADLEFGCLLDAVGRVAASIRQRNDVGSRRLCLQQERREVRCAEWMTYAADDLPAARQHFFARLLLEIVPERVVGGDEEPCLGTGGEHAACR